MCGKIAMATWVCELLVVVLHGERGPLRVPTEAGGVYGVVWLSPPPQPARLLNQPACIAPGLRSGLRWLKISGDDPVGCWC